MKIRISGDSLRMRLSQSEVDKLASSSMVIDAINFGKAKLTYQLSITETSEMSAIYKNDLIQIGVPKSIGKQWATSDQVGIEENIRLNENDSLYILIEKDFKCLTDRPREDESDLYENPLNKHNC